MIKDRLIICIANSWDYDPTSKHQVVKILARYNDVVWVNYHGTRRPGINKKDFSATFSALRRVACGIRRVSPSMIQVTPLVIPGAAGPVLRSVQRRLLITQIRHAVHSVEGWRTKPTQLWTFAPDTPYLVGEFDEECAVYYCVDEYSQFEGFNGRRIVAAENELIDRASVVITTSEALFQRKRERRSDVVLMRHGVDYDHFASAWQSVQRRPSDVSSLPRPVFGFIGLVHHWVDRALLAKVAHLRPSYSFVVLGDCKVDVAELRCLENVHLLGRRPYESLPAYCAAFDAGLMLFECSAMTRNVNPVKMREYLAAGLPVISTSLPEAERFRGPILFGDSPESFAAACDRVVGEDSPFRRESISQMVAHETWLSRVEYLSQIVMNRLNRTGRVATRPARDVLPSAPRRGEATPVLTDFKGAGVTAREHRPYRAGKE